MLRARWRIAQPAPDRLVVHLHAPELDVSLEVHDGMGVATTLLVWRWRTAILAVAQAGAA